MKIRTQDARRYLEFEEVYADMHVDGKKAAVYVRNRLNLEPVCVGVYESMFRARGVL